MKSSVASSSELGNLFFRQLTASLDSNRPREVVEKYLAPTPEALLELGKLCGCHRLYLAPVYIPFLNNLLVPVRRSSSEMPRGSFKSTWIMLSITRDILLNPNIRILYGSETMPNAKKYLLWIKRQFEMNEKFRKVFGNFVPETGWKCAPGIGWRD